jgi:ACS family hexuronate transporter-like MFS transporter
LANSLLGFAAFRFLLGAGESGNWPAAIKVVGEWFPKDERALATALFDSGSSVGGAIAPFIVLGIYFRWGWRPAFMIPGFMGLIWLIAWRWLYQPPESHPRLAKTELDLILAERRDISSQHDARHPRWSDLLRLPQTWGIIVAKSFTDPVWFFITDWFPIYLVAKGIDLKHALVAVWVPFVAADAGNFFSGWMSGLLIKRGWSLGRARKALIVFGGVGVTLLIPTVLTTNLFFITLLFALSTFAYACFTTMANVLPSDVYDNEFVASVSGLSGTGAGVGTIIAFKLIGYLSDSRQSRTTHAFDPILIVAGLIPFLGMILVLVLLRNTKATDEGLVRRI